MGLTDGTVVSMSGFKQELLEKRAEAAASLNPNKLNGQAVLAELKSMGISKLDAELVTDCVNVHKACVWQNTDEVSDAQVAAARKFLADNRLGISLEVTPGRFGKYIWETKLARYQV
ncbi:Uncharacterised protein [uncultured archaeon]|nr:Uncharacterised protein [uncultured archaeon]